MNIIEAGEVFDFVCESYYGQRVETEMMIASREFSVEIVLEEYQSEHSWRAGKVDPMSFADWLKENGYAKYQRYSRYYL